MRLFKYLHVIIIIIFVSLLFHIDMCSAQHATHIKDDFTRVDHPGWSLMGDAIMAGALKLGGWVILTENKKNQAGAIWNNDIKCRGPFIAEFSYGFNPVGEKGGDGIVFAFYTKRPDAKQPLGRGGNLGFPGSGYGIEIDYNKNGFDPSGQHIALICGSTRNHLKVEDLPRFSDPDNHHMKVEVKRHAYYVPTPDSFFADSAFATCWDKVNVYIDDMKTPVLTWEGRFEPELMGDSIGFTAATGSLSSWQSIDDFYMYFPDSVDCYTRKDGEFLESSLGTGPTSS